MEKVIWELNAFVYAFTIMASSEMDENRAEVYEICAYTIQKRVDILTSRCVESTQGDAL